MSRTSRKQSKHKLKWVCLHCRSSNAIHDDTCIACQKNSESYDSNYKINTKSTYIQPNLQKLQTTNMDNDTKHNDTDRAEPPSLNFDAAKKTPFKQDKPICVKDQIWISTGNQKGEQGMICYNYTTNNTSFMPYPPEITLNAHSCCSHGDKMYIIDGNNCSVIRFNPKRETIVKFSSIPNLGNDTACVAIHDSIHIFGGSNNNRHIIRSIDGKKDDFIELPDPAAIDGKNIMAPCVVAYHNRIIKFGGRFFDERISSFYMSSTIHKNNYKNIKWACPGQFQLPHGLCECGYILYEHYIITFGGNTPIYIDTIYVLDVEKNVGWMRMKHIKCPLASNYRAVLDNNEMVHLYSTINRWPNWEESVVKHYTIPIEQILNGLNEGYKDALELQFKRVCDGNVRLQMQVQGQLKQMELQKQQMEMKQKQMKMVMKENEQCKIMTKQLMNERVQIMQLMKNEVNKMQVKNDELQKQLEESQEDCKQLQLELIENEEKYNQETEDMGKYIGELEADKELLMRKLNRMQGNVNDNNNKEEKPEIRPWCSDDLVDWIVTIKDGQFSKYEDVLRETFKIEGVNGLSLEHIDKAELRNWGIHSVVDRGVLFGCIQELIKQNNQSEGNDDDTTY